MKKKKKNERDRKRKRGGIYREEKEKVTERERKKTFSHPPRLQNDFEMLLYAFFAGEHFLFLKP